MSIYFRTFINIKSLQSKIEKLKNVSVKVFIVLSYHKNLSRKNKIIHIILSPIKILKTNMQLFTIGHFLLLFYHIFLVNQNLYNIYPSIKNILYRYIIYYKKNRSCKMHDYNILFYRYVCIIILLI
jgi:hypothetical protein